MQSGERHEPIPPTPERGLPPVEPPSGRFIAQLFLVPGLIVLGVVLALIAVFYLTKAGHTPEYFLRQLDSDNADIRWRAASDLAQIIKRPDKDSLRWKTDAAFALDLAERLRRALDELQKAEQELQEKIARLPAEEREANWRRLAPLRHHVSYLAAALGDFHVPVGVPLLGAVAEREQAADAKGNVLRRRQALWALANLGANTKRFQKVPAEQQADVLAALKREAAGTSPHRAAWARTALYYLDRSALSSDVLADVVRVDEVLATCSRSEDRNIRELVAMAFNFWDGPQAEPTLLRLAHDDGHGTLLRVTEAD
jgi:hypothetical protein